MGRLPQGVRQQAALRRRHPRLDHPHATPTSTTCGTRARRGRAELNFVSYKNDEVDTLLERGRGTFDRAERKRCYDRIQEILAEEQPYIFLYVPDALPIFNARVRGIDPAPIGIGHNVIRWYVPKEEQKYVMTQ